jgi:hypothetical protein
MNVLTVLTLGLALIVSFLLWIFVAYGTTRFFKFAVCSVCGSVVSIWGLNLVFHFLPAWIGLLLMGESVVGGATLFRNKLLVPRIARMSRTRYAALAQVTWFGFILGGSLVLGTAGLLLARS